MKKFCMTCGQDTSHLPVLKEGDILRCKRTGRLAIVRAWRNIYRGFVDVVILTGDHKGRNSIWKREDIEIMHGYFHIDRNKSGLYKEGFC